MADVDTRVSAPGGPAGAGNRTWALLGVLAGNMLIDALEVSTLVVAAPTVGRAVGLPPAGLQWLLTGFALGFAGLLLLGPRLAARWGRRRVYLGGLAVFAAASLLAGVTRDPGVLVATRFVKGCCAALTAPMGLAIILGAFPDGPARRRAISVYTFFGACGFSAGLLLSGALTGWNWHWTLAFPAPIVLVLLLAGARLIPGPARGSGAPAPPLDVAGAVALTGTLVALVTGLAAVPGHGWTGPRTLLPLGAAVLMGVLLVAVERAAAQPLLRASLFRNGALARSALGAASLNGSYLGLLLVVTVQLQDRLHWSPLGTALAMLPASAPLALTALRSAAVVARFGARPLIALGALAAFAGELLLLRQGLPTRYASGLLPTVLLLGAAFVLAFTALNTQAVSGFPDGEKAAAGATYQTAVQAGAAVVPALVALVLPTGPVGAATAGAYRPAEALVAGVGLLGLVAAAGGLRTTRPGGRGGGGTG
ncbi:MFS transporter [Kitasatospora sp. NPDC096077]|uniref:MFS transporter n=1 Tax=Kitasatospora sp. NPDC096077 TaxID=3155544 RepID=UPI00331C7061